MNDDTNELTASVEIIVSAASRVNFASAQNAVPAIKSLDLRSLGEEVVEGLRLSLKAQPPFLREKTWVFDRLDAKGNIAISDRDVTLDLAFLDKLNEAEMGQLEFTLRTGEQIVAECVQPIEILARDEWGGVEGMDQILAAFVSPNDPAVAALLKEASRILETAGHASGLDGYQTKDPGRAWMIAAAIWSAATALDLSYAEPPKSFEKAGQKVRGPGRIVGEGLATCLDTTLLLAAALEAAGLNPIVVFVENHAFAGVWLQDMSFRSTVERDPTELRKAVAARELVTFETTLLCRRPAIGFDHAISEARIRLTEEKEHLFDRAVDVRRCRSANIRPLSTHRAATIAETVEDASAAAPLPPPPDFDLLPGELVEEEPTIAHGRIARWQRKLLDLSLRNKLLNFTETKQSIPLVCPDVPKLEDSLADGKNFSIVSLIDENPVGNRDPDLHRQRYGEDIESSYARTAFDRRELCARLSGKELMGRLTTLYRKVRSDISEGGTNTLFLAIGFLRWKKSSDDNRVYRAPLLLLPAKLTRRSAASGYKLSHHEDEVRFNATLLEFLKQGFNLEIPSLAGDLPTDTAGIDVHSVFEIMRAAVRDTPGFEISDEASIGTFSFSKFLMWKDLVDRTDALRKNRLVKHLINSAEGEKYQACGGVEARQFPAPRDIDYRLKPKDFLTPLPADSSQLVAVVAAEQGHDFIIVGPPGTGKSQTISNIIAHCLAKGKTVLFVAEKAAALDVVYRRLRDYGLGDACLELHSNKSDRTRVLKQLGAAWNRPAHEANREWIRVTGNLEVNRDRLNAYVEALHAAGSHGLSVFQAIGLAAKSEEPVVELSYDNMDAHDPESFADLRNLAHRAGVTWSQAKDSDALGSVSATEWSYAWEKEFRQCAESVGIAAEAARARASELSIAIGLPDEASVSNSRRILLERFAETVAAVGDGDFRLALERDLSKFVERIEPIVALLKTVAGAKERLLGDYEEREIMRIQIDRIDQNWREAITKMWPLSAMAKRRVRKLLSTYAKPGARAAEPAADIVPLRQLKNCLHELSTDPLAALPVFVGSDTAPKTLRNWVAVAMDFRAVADDILKLGGAPKALEAVAGVGGEASETARTACAFADAMVELRNTVATHAAHAGGAPEIEGLADVKRTYEGMLAQLARLADRVRWAALRDEAVLRGLSPLLDALEEGRVEADNSEDVFLTSYVHWWLPLALDRSEALRGFLIWEHEDLRSTFIDLDETAQDLAAAQIRQTLAHDLPAKNEVPRNSELGMLRHQLGLTRPSMAIRELIGRMPTTFTKLAPCVLMSPLSVAQYLPADHQCFDLVIFDEASQIFTWDAVGVIARGKQAIVCGDPKQLPPTNFFGRAESEDDDVEIYEMDLPSILDEVAVAGIREHQLNWHYRSRDEALIVFSNRNYYGGQLVTFPAPTIGKDAVRLHRLEGVFGRGKSRTNRVEADAIVAFLIERMTAQLDVPEDERKTIGVITFNRQQQELILDLLDDARRRDPRLEWFFDEDRVEPTIVKNLENIQGDERDVMALSIAFGPDDAGRVTMNFGALNPEGGEKRLNVAVTRSRFELHVFTSLDSQQIDLSRTNSTGVAHLKQFLDYVERGPVALAGADEGSLGPADNLFEEAVAEALRGKGWEVRTQIGVSGFRIDLGIVHPDYAGVYIAGVECDGYTYHGSATARDRDRIRENVLTGLGWRILRVWSTDWFHNCDEATDRLHTRLTDFLEEDRVRGAAAKRETAGKEEATLFQYNDDMSLNSRTNGKPGSGPLPHGYSDQRHDMMETASTRNMEEPNLRKVASFAPVTGNVASPDETTISDSAFETVDPDPQIDTEGASAPVQHNISELPDMGRSQSHLAPYLEYSGQAGPDPRSAHTAQVAEGLCRIIQCEGPLSAKRAYDIYLRGCGIQRMGGELKRLMNRAIQLAVRQDLVVKEDEWDVGGLVHSIVRSPDALPVLARKRGPRKFDEIPPSEIQLVARQLLMDRNFIDDSGSEKHLRAVLGKFELQRLTTSIGVKLLDILERRYSYVDEALEHWGRNQEPGA